MMDDLGYDVDYISDIDYELLSQDQTRLFKNNYRVEFTGSKFVETAVFARVSKMVSDSVGQLLADSVFIAVAEAECQ